MTRASGIGAKILDPGRAFLLFARWEEAPRLPDLRPVSSARLFALETVAGSGAAAGYALGVNATGLACAHAAVARRPGALPAAALVQLALERCVSVVEALD